jgi:hypothetical protein
MKSYEIREIRIKLYGDDRNSFSKWRKALGYSRTSHLRRFELDEDDKRHETPSQITINLIKLLVKVKEFGL